MTKLSPIPATPDEIDSELPAPKEAKPETPFMHGGITLYRAEDLRALDPMEWRVADFLPTEGTACVYGASRSGKSFLCLDLAACIALGRSWFGHETKKAMVFYIVLEGRDGQVKRIDAWAKQAGVPYPDDVTFIIEPWALTEPSDVTDLIGTIKRFGGQNVVVIIDTLNRAAPGVDENSPTGMGLVLQGASEIQVATGGLVILVHHPGKDASRGLRGHSSLFAGMDSIIEVERDGESRRLKLTKSKDGEDGATHAFRLVKLELQPDKTGKARNSCAVEPILGHVRPSAMQRESLGDNQRIVLDGVENILKAGAGESDSTATDSPTSIAFEQAVSRLKDLLCEIDPKRRRERTLAALDSLAKAGWLTLEEGNISLSEMVLSRPTK